MLDVAQRPEAPVAKHDYNLLIDERWCRVLAIDEATTVRVRQFRQPSARVAPDVAAIYREESAGYGLAKYASLMRGISRSLSPRHQPGPGSG